MSFDKQKYLDKCFDKLTKEINGLESLRDDSPDLKEIIDRCFDYYEKDSLTLYCVFNRVCDSPGGFHFFGNLRSFLVNTILDDSYFKITWEDDEPILDWAYEEDEEGTQDSKKILEIFDWYDKEDLKRQQRKEETDRLLEMLRDRTRKGF